MATPKRLRERAAKFFLGRENESERSPKGVNLPQAKTVALLYVDSGEDYFKEVKSLVKDLHDVYGVKSVCAMGFVDAKAREIPVYQAQKLEYMYFTRGDLNWHMSPTASLKNFISEPFDLLIDLSEHPCLPLQYVVKASKSRMKVGTGSAEADELYDICIQHTSEMKRKEVWKTLLHYLTKPNLR